MPAANADLPSVATPTIDYAWVTIASVGSNDVGYTVYENVGCADDMALSFFGVCTMFFSFWQFSCLN